MADENNVLETNNTDSKARKKKWDYHLMLFVDNDKGDIKQMGINRRVIEVLGACVAIVILALAIALSMNVKAKRTAQASNEQLTAQVGELQTQVDTLSEDNKVLNDKVVILSDTVNAKVEEVNAIQEVDDASHMPEGFPLSASASMTTDENDANTVILACSSGANIISAGAGTVLEILPDADYDNCIRVDHGNGYITEYYNASTPVVKTGDQVLKGSILFVVEDGCDKLAYKVYLDDKQVDPMSVIKIDG